MNDARPAGEMWAVLELLDRQIVDRDGTLAGKVDDLEFELPDEPDGLPVVTGDPVRTRARSPSQIGGDARALARRDRAAARRAARAPAFADPVRSGPRDRRRRSRSTPIATISTAIAAIAGRAT